MAPLQFRIVARTLLIGSVTAVAAAQSSPPLYPGPIAQKVTHDAIAPVVTDINGDGLLDVVSVGGGSNTVSVAYGRGGFEFGESEDFVTGTYNPGNSPWPYDVAVGDFNEDGQPDLAVANGYQATVGVLLQANGTFGPSMQFIVGTGTSETWSVAIGDLNEDGHLDLVAPCVFTDVVSVLLGTGTGDFTLLMNKRVGSSPLHAVVDDVDGDGHQDVLISNGGKVSVLLGLGDGNLAEPADYTAGQWPHAFVLVDFDRDGRRDLVVANAGSDSISILPGLAGGTFGPATNYFAGDEPSELGVADLDGDGNLDVVAISHGSDWLLNMFVLMGQGGGVLGPPEGYAVGGIGWFGAATDLDADGEVDLIVGGFQQRISILPGQGGGKFETATHSKLLKEADAVAVGDLTADGIPDLVVANSGWDSVSVLRGSGTGTFAPDTSSGVGSKPTSVALGDLDGDGDLDVAVANMMSNTVSVLLNQGAGVLGPPSDSHVLVGPQSIVLGDFDNDGLLDCATAGYFFTNGGISVLLGVGGGAFGTATAYEAGSYPISLATGDLNGDGWLDLAAAVSGGAAVLLGQGGGLFGTAVIYDTQTLGQRSIAIGDLNGDTIPDLTMTTSDSGAGTIALLLGRGNGQFHLARSLHVGGDPRSVSVDDLNADGFTDIAMTNTTSCVTVILGSGPMIFDPPTFHALLGAEALAVADLNADGRPDLAVADGYTNGYPYIVSVLLNKGEQARSAWTILASGLAGTAGVPLLVGEGELTGGSPGSLQLTSAAPIAPAILFVATSSAPAAFKCGTLVPVPILSALAGTTDAGGAIPLAWSSWPPGVTGIELYFQYAVQDAAAPCGVALSNALKADVP